MALFTRRRLQRILDENARFLKSDQLRTSVKLLNSVYDEYLAKEWELALLNAASKHGHVEHEPGARDERKPDLRFRSNDDGVAFIADVATISDRGFHRENPVDAFEEEFWGHLDKMRLLPGGGFHTEIDEYLPRVGVGSEQKVRLKLPRPREFGEKIFDKRFFDFLRAVRRAPEQPHRFDVAGPDVGVHFAYDPAKRGTGGGGHRSFTVATVIDRNPVYTALKEKRDQLKAVPYSGFRGIFLCDGGCQMLRSTSTNGSSYSVQDVIRYFFQQSDSVAFVVCLAVHADFGWTFRDRQRSIKPTIYASQRFNPHFSAFTGIIGKIVASLPDPQSSPENAMEFLRATNNRFGRRMGQLQTGGHVKMSARMLLELLAGTKTLKEFGEDYSFEKNGNPFRRMLDQGRLISQFTVEHHPDEDDDVVTISFGEPDPAVSPFHEHPKPE
jgi:hypothetical protein